MNNDVLTAVLLKLKELQAMIGGAVEDAPMTEEVAPIEAKVEEKKVESAKDSDRAPELKIDKEIEGPIGRGPISFKEKAKMFNKK